MVYSAISIIDSARENEGYLLVGNHEARKDSLIEKGAELTRFYTNSYIGNDIGTNRSNGSSYKYDFLCTSFPATWDSTKLNVFEH